MKYLLVYIALFFLLFYTVDVSRADAHSVGKRLCKQLVNQSNPQTIEQWRNRYRRCGVKARRHNARHRGAYRTAEASYYKLWGNRTACGQTSTSSTVWVAALKSAYAKCGLKVRLCYDGRCVNTTVQDRGAWRSDNRYWDMTWALKNRLGCPDLCQVKWKEGW